MFWKLTVWAATAVICFLTLVLLLPSLLKVGYGTMRIFAGALRAHWRGRRQLQRARKVKCGF